MCNESTDAHSGHSRVVLAASLRLTNVFITAPSFRPLTLTANFAASWASGLRQRVDTWGLPIELHRRPFLFDDECHDLETRIADEGASPLATLTTSTSRASHGQLAPRSLPAAADRCREPSVDRAGTGRIIVGPTTSRRLRMRQG
jgi:hypothetical protein